ncbi:MAG TPA: dihydroneopterin aldolase [Candidatus Limnocylindria bacterium]|nr:dihydroneopterin aldolase [Candidatus Limnocylindria bacterium]
MTEDRSGDRIELRGMRFLGRHGVTLDERMEPQPFEVDVVMWASLDAAVRSDDLTDTVDYSAVFGVVAEIVQGRSFRLIEALAGSIIEAVLESQPLVESVEVRVRKPQAPLPGTFDTVEAVVCRDRPA